MSNNDSPEPPTEWAYDYWNALRKVAEFDNNQSKRADVFDARCQLTQATGRETPAVLSTTAVTDFVADTLVSKGIYQQPSEYSRSQFNQLYPEFERLAVGYRVPKLDRDDQYYIFPATPLSGWQAQTPPDPLLRPTNEPDGYGTCLFGNYLTARLDAVDPTAGITLPLEALLYSTVGMYAPVDALSPDRSQTFTPGTVDVEVCTGDIETLRTTDQFDVDALAEQLALETTLPPIDEDVIGGANDFGLFGRVTVPAEIDLAAHDRLEQQLASQLESWTASVLALYTYPEAAGDNKADELNGAKLSRAQLGKAVNTIAAQPPRDHINRSGLDTRVISHDDSDHTHVLCGTYRRTNDDTPLADEPTAVPPNDDDD